MEKAYKSKIDNLEKELNKVSEELILQKKMFNEENKERLERQVENFLAGKGSTFVDTEDQKSLY